MMRHLLRRWMNRQSRSQQGAGPGKRPGTIGLDGVNFAAGTFTISVSAAQRGNHQASSQTFQVLIDGVAEGTFTPAGTSYAVLTTGSFTVTAGAHTILFKGTNPNGGDNTSLIDQVQVNVAGILDAGFEAPRLGSGPAAFQYNPGGTPWTFTGSSGVAGNGSAFTKSNPNAPGGNQVAFLQGFGSVSQSVVFAAGTYSLSFSAAQRGNNPVQASTQQIQVLVDGVVVGTFTPAGTSYGVLTTSNFTLTAGNHTITFKGLNPNGGDNTALIDQVVLNPM